MFASDRLENMFVSSRLFGVLLLMSAAIFGGPVSGNGADVTNRFEPSVVWPGRKADGSVLLPNQWSLRPVGRQLELGDFPVNIAIHPGGKFAAILHCGYGEHEIVVVDIAGNKIVSRTGI